MSKMLLLSPDQALQNWPEISMMLNRALEHGQGESTLTDYMRKIINYNAQCWAIVGESGLEGCGLTEILTYAQHKTLHIIVFAGSNFEDQAKHFQSVLDFAKHNGCKSVEQWGRDGWMRMLPKYLPKFKKVYTVMRYDLEDTDAN
jgi:hypothetical protein